MQPMSLGDIASACGGSLVGADSGAVVTGVSTDTRTLRSGDLFFALVGENMDGHRFVADALNAGAAVAVVSKDDIDGPRIVVDDTLKALGDTARFYRSGFSPVVVGVTGSVGKTTTKEMIAQIAAAKGSVLANEGNFNNEIGLPLTLLKLEPAHQVAVLEMAMRGPGQIDYLCDIARPSIGVITNVGISHIELLGSMDAIAAAKGEILDHLPADGAAVLNADDAYFEPFRTRAKCRVVSFGRSEAADIRADDERVDSQGFCSFTARTPHGDYELNIPLPGLHVVEDALAAVAAACELGVPMETAADALGRFNAPDKRANVRTSRAGFTVIDDTYNASPQSVMSALRTLKLMDASRRIAVLGDMLELGGHAEDAHRQTGRAAAEAGVDVLIAVGDLAGHIAEGAIEAGVPNSSVRRFEDSSTAAQGLRDELGEGDVVLVKGSRAMKMEKVVEGLLASD